MKPGRFYIKVILAPEFRNRRLGAQMYEDALRVAREHGATELESSIREDDPIALRFVESTDSRSNITPSNPSST